MAAQQTQTPETFDFEANRMLSIRKVSEMLGISQSTLRKHCTSGEGPKLIKLSSRRVGIRVKDLNLWLAQQETKPEKPRIH
jgi:predicted DNA-binding transcriptional regulator AlpA